MVGRVGTLVVVVDRRTLGNLVWFASVVGVVVVGMGTWVEGELGDRHVGLHVGWLGRHEMQGHEGH